MTKSRLFSKFAVRDVVLKNRIVASPMWQYCGVNGRPTDWHLMNLGRLADGGAGLVFQEATTVERRGCGTPGDIGIWDDDCIPLYARIVQMIESCGSVAGIQLGHAGRKAKQKPPQEGRGPLEPTGSRAEWDAWDMIAPSPIPQSDGYPVPREMTLSDILAVTEAFVSATRRADKAGYQVLNVHAAHGYLLHEFLSPLSNRRTDGYGGSFEGRTRHLLEIVEGIRSVWPASKPLFVRLSVVDGGVDGWTMPDSIRLVPLLKQRGVDVIDCSAGGISGSPLPSGKAAEYGYQVDFAEQLRREAGLPTSAVGLIVHAQHAEHILQKGAADLIGLARELIHNPNWPLDAALKLGDEVGYNALQRREGFWLERRALTVPNLVPSTFMNSTTGSWN